MAADNRITAQRLEVVFVHDERRTRLWCHALEDRRVVDAEQLAVLGRNRC